MDMHAAYAGRGIFVPDTDWMCVGHWLRTKGPRELPEDQDDAEDASRKSALIERLTTSSQYRDQRADPRSRKGSYDDHELFLPGGVQSCAGLYNLTTFSTLLTLNAPWHLPKSCSNESRI